MGTLKMKGVLFIKCAHVTYDYKITENKDTNNSTANNQHNNSYVWCGVFKCFMFR